MSLLLVKTKLILAFQKGNIFYRFLRALCFVKVKDVIKDCWVTIYVQTPQNKWPWMHFGLFHLLFTYLFFREIELFLNFMKIFFLEILSFFANLTLPKTWFSLSRIFCLGIPQIINEEMNFFFKFMSCLLFQRYNTLQ